MRVTQRMLIDNVLANISANSSSLGGLQEQLSSGKKLRKPSDDPQALSRALTLRATSDRNSQYLRNITSARGWLEATDSSLGQMEGVLERARDAALRGLSDSIGDDGRKQLGEQVDGLLEELLQGLNATHEGKYLFSGRLTTTLPFQATRVDGKITSVAYRPGDPQGEMSRELAEGVDVVVNTPGDQFAGTNQPLLSAVSNLVELRDWLKGTSSTPVDVAQLTASLDGVTSIHATVGARMQRVDGTENVLNQESVNISTMLSRAEDADVAEVMTKLIMQENVYKAALQAGSRVIQPSLLDYLK